MRRMTSSPLAAVSIPQRAFSDTKFGNEYDMYFRKTLMSSGMDAPTFVRQMAAGIEHTIRAHAEYPKKPGDAVRYHDRLNPLRGASNLVRNDLTDRPGLGD